MCLPVNNSFCGVLLVMGLITVLYVRADYQVKVQLFTFENPTHQFPRSPGADPPAFCCDGGGTDPCTGDICDIYIVLCLNPFGLPVAVRFNTNCDNDTVRVSEVFTTPNPTMDVDDITFDVGETALLGLPNPFIINQTGEWPGGIQLVVQVFDDDSNGNNDVDDSVQRVIINIDQLGASPPALIVGAQDVGMINVSYEVACTENYYGPNCAIFCEERDNEQGHYICDSEGNIVCRDGYNDTSTNCTECIPADGCSPVGGYCTEGNECVCYPEYTGDLCESDLNICRQITCQNGGTCMNTGPDMALYECMCPEEFEGVNCEFDRTDECDPDPCENGATCMDLVADYSCSCPPGFIGKNCEREEGEGSSSEGVDAVTLAGGAVGIVLLILIILILVVVLVFIVKKQRHMKVQIINEAHPTTTGTINLKLNPVYGVSTTQAQTNFPATSEVIALKPNPVYGVSSAPQDTTEYYMNEGMGPVEPPQYDYPVVEPRQPTRAKDIPVGQNPAYSSTSN